MNEYVIYKHTNMINGKVYIGKTCQEPEARYGSNGCGYKACPYFYQAIKKYGWENFRHEILYSHLTLDEANQLETECIKAYDSCNKKNGYNIRSGGDGFDSKTSRELWSRQEYVDKIVKANKENWNNETYKDTMSAKMREAWKDPAKRHRRSNTAKERWTDKAFHDKVQAKVKEACKTSVRCIETGVVYDAVVDAAEAYHIHHSNLIRAIRTGRRSGGVHWAYTNVL